MSALRRDDDAGQIPFPDIPRIVVTGGPSGGKSTGMAILRQKLAAWGVQVFVVPELATELFTNGVNPSVLAPDPARWRALQQHIIRTQMAHEDQWAAAAALHPDGPKVLLCDRGVADGQAYMDAAAFDTLVEETVGAPLSVLKETRYAGVLHLVTAAAGAEAFYTTANNAARTETPAEARALDARTAAAWVGHRTLRVVGNDRLGADGVRTPISFDEKMHMVLGEACRMLGLPVPSRHERKFLVTSVDATALPGPCVQQQITQTYLRSTEPGVERRLRTIRSAQGTAPAAPGVPQPRANGSTVYLFTEKRRQADGGVLRTERILSPREYVTLLDEADDTVAVLHKTRTSFLFEQQYFQLDEEVGGPTYLEVEPTSHETGVQLPPGVVIAAEVSTDPTHYARERQRTMVHRRAGPRAVTR